nr:hypothetical protein [Flavobacterium sp. MC2016-06]
MSFGGFEANGYDCQINSDYGPNGGSHISFRTKNGDANIWNSWNELATRGTNTFDGNQVINGFIKSQTANGNYNENLRLLPSTTGGYSSIALGATPGDYGTGIGQWTIIRYPASYNYMFSLRYNSTDYFNILNNGNVGIGTLNPSNRLDVNGTIHSKEVKIDMIGWSDFVFKKEYNLPKLEDLEKHIIEKGHLENIPSEEEVLKNGINLGEMNAKLLQKIEELTLYAIEQNKKINELQKENERFSDIENRLEKLENVSK